MTVHKHDGKRMVDHHTGSAVIRGIPHDVFDSRSLPNHARFEAWRATVLPLFESHLEHPPQEGFSARVDAFKLRRMVICVAEFSGQRYLRRRGHRADEGADPLLIQLYLSGGYVGHNGYRTVRVGPGDISLLDLGYSLETRAERSRALSFIVPREAMFSFLPPEHAQIGSVIPARSAVGRILSHHLLCVWNALHGASADEDEHITQTVLGAVAGAFAGYGTGESQVLESHLLDAICAYIERNLSAENLTPAHLCRKFACSRARLYRLFRPLGGVAAFVRQARLKRCFQELTEPRAIRPSVIEVAMRWGFTSQSHFSRLFRANFGITPSEAIEQAQAQRRARTGSARPAYSPHSTFHHWLSQL